MLALRPFITKLQEESKGQNPVRYCQKNLVPNYLKYYFDKDSEKEPRRAIISSVYHEKTPHHMCLSGTIVDREKFTLISQPPMNFKSMNWKEINMEDYYVFPINIGTTITLYWYKGEWHIATTNRFFAGKTNMIYGNISYETALKECLPAEFDWKALDTNKCYTLGFSHPKAHPGSPKRVWMIASFDVSAWNSGKEVTHDWFAKLPGVENIEEVKEPDLRSLETSLNKYMEDGTQHFGYILRSRDESKTNTASCVCMQSTLFQRVNSMLYSNESNNEIMQKDYDRFRFMALRALLSPHGPALFKQWCGTDGVEYVDSISKQISDSVKYISELYEKKNVPRDTDEQKLAHSLFKSISSFMTSGNTGTIMNMVVVKDYISTFASHLM